MFGRWEVVGELFRYSVALTLCHVLAVALFSIPHSFAKI
jgi:hypothetical protein